MNERTPKLLSTCDVGSAEVEACAPAAIPCSGRPLLSCSMPTAAQADAWRGPAKRPVPSAWRQLTVLAIAFAGCVCSAGAAHASDVTHRFLACGQETYIMDESGNKEWSYPHSTRDGFVLADGTVLLTLSKSKKYPGGAVVRIQANGEESLLWRGTQAEVNSVHPTAEGTFVLTEAGPKPRLLELDATGKTIQEFPLACQLENHHMQTRMARKEADGTYLVPHLLDFAVFQYGEDGTVLSKIDTTVAGDAQHAIHSWPFTGIRHDDGQTLVCCTHANRVVDFDSTGKVHWQLTNEDLPGEWLQDPCGGQLLPNGNIVVTSYAGGQKDPQAPKLIEVNRDKKVVWTHSDGQKHGIHHFQILSTNGTPLEGPVLK
ncbi:SMP-30/gluconolactonase/LRE family protein [Aureliella helgolandensis]|uniref:Arylsulfotransferase (ASST) n=1 Tax=Aureliella helgolandensis TaxID=2527968 RepID=A0A518GA69_9BACT|nr:hypothetical protein [Aureliella helgolandensis]QDV25463.1 hypothetical protein Q31a_37890 [Aureliella helgolandensis]